MTGPGWVAQWLRALSQYAEVVGSIPAQGTYKKQRECIDKWNSKSTFLSLSNYFKKNDKHLSALKSAST